MSTQLRVLAKALAERPGSEDVRDVGAMTCPPADLICGGFPCQDISNAGGKRAGIDGERSGLWSEYARTHWRATTPATCIVENVVKLSFLEAMDGG
jgi:DNA (cytosine-5)-methyltransferase 1